MGNDLFKSEMNQDASSKRVNKWRVSFAGLYFVLGVVLILVFRDKMFYTNTKLDGFENIYRLIWCLSITSVGFAAIAFVHRHLEKSPLPEYLLHYPFQLGAMASLIFGILHIFEATSGYQFYFISGGLCYTLGYLVDSYWAFIMAVIRSKKL